MTSLLKVVEQEDSMVSALERGRDGQRADAGGKLKRVRECWNCGKKHEYHNKELCPAYSKTCNKCHKQNHFAVTFCSKGPPPTVKTVENAQSSGDTREAPNMPA